MTDRPEANARRLGWIRGLALLALVSPSALVLAAWGLARAGLAPGGMWLQDAVLLAPLAGLLAAGLALLAALGFWLSGAAPFRRVRAAAGLAALALVVNFLLMAFIFYRLRF
jgi:hypothetical protein